MTTPSQLGEDLRYVRRLLQPSRPAPAVIPLLWAALGVPGFALADFAPKAVPIYWAIAGPAGTLLSVWLGYRGAIGAGDLDRTVGIRWTVHWLSVLAVIGLAALTAATGILTFSSLNPVILLILTMAYALAGVHLDHALYWPAAALALTLPAVALLPSYGWTVGGGLVALALAFVALGGRGRRRA